MRIPLEFLTPANLYVSRNFYHTDTNVDKASDCLPTNVAFFLISSMVLGHFDQLQIFRQLYLIEFQGF